MTFRTKQTLRALARHTGLRVKYVSDLPGKVPGFLDPSNESRTIVVNAKRSKSDHVFTILHEIGHYLLHYRRSHRPPLPWYLKRQWKSRGMTRFSTRLRRYAAKVLNEEREADLWAICALIQIRATDDLCAIMDQYPEKWRLFYLSLAGSLYAGIKSRIKRAFGRMFYPFIIVRS